MTTDPTSTPPATLFASMAAVMGDISRLQKGGTNEHFGYKYTTDGDVYDAIRPLLAEHHIAFFASITDREIIERIETNYKGKEVTNFHTIVTMQFTFACGITGQTYSSIWQGESMDRGDKSIAKAIAFAQKTFLLKTFVMSTGDPQDEPDSDSRLNDEGSKSTKRTTTRPPAAKPPAPRPPVADIDPIDALRDLVWQFAPGSTDAEIARLAGLNTLTIDALRAKYSSTHAARDAIKTAFDQLETPAPISSNGHATPEQPPLIDDSRGEEHIPF